MNSKCKGVVKEGNAFLNTSQNLIKEMQNRTIIYKIFNIKYNKMERATPQQLEIALKPIQQQKLYVMKGKRFSTVAVWFPTAQEAREPSTVSLKGNNLWLTPAYLGRRVAKLTVHEIPPELSICWLVAAVSFNIGDIVTILQVKKLHHQS